MNSIEVHIQETPQPPSRWIGIIIVALLITGFLAAAIYNSAYQHHNWSRFIIWVAAGCTLGIYTVLYRENPVFRFLEHLFLGVATGYGVQIAITTIIIPKWWTPFVQQREWYWIFALLIGSMFYFVYSKRMSWIARWVMGLFIGMNAGVYLMQFVTTYMPQLKSSIKPIVQISGGRFMMNFNYLLIFITLVTVMSYFFFSIEHKRPTLAGSAKIGRWLLMIAFGAIFGNTVMARVSLLIERMQFLLGNWLDVLPK